MVVMVVMVVMAGQKISSIIKNWKNIFK
jgi:hypothetical protein